MAITDMTDNQLDVFEANYRKEKKTVGGKYSLSEILLEKKRRKPSEFGTREVAAKIIELANKSSDGLCTYGSIWSAFRPDAPWEGHKTLRIVADSLGRVIYYCVINKLPILTTLVVQAGTRRLSPGAIRNIYNECRDLGVDVGLEPEAFVSDQVRLSRSFVINELPAPEASD